MALKAPIPPSFIQLLFTQYLLLLSRQGSNRVENELQYLIHRDHTDNKLYQIYLIQNRTDCAIQRFHCNSALVNKNGCFRTEGGPAILNSLIHLIQSRISQIFM